MSAPGPDDYRQVWAATEAAWSDTVARVRRLPESKLHERVDDEWSFVETQRHLVFATDAWIRRTILGEPRAYHRLGLPPDGDVDVRPWGIEVDATPTFAEVMAVRDDRLATVRGIVADLTDDELSRVCARNPSPGHPPHTMIPVRVCLDVVFGEEWSHHAYAVRDLAELEER